MNLTILKSWRIAVTLLALSIAAGCVARSVPSVGETANPTRLMAPGALEALPSQAPDRRVADGTESSQ